MLFTDGRMQSLLITSIGVLKKQGKKTLSFIIAWANLIAIWQRYVPPGNLVQVIKSWLREFHVNTYLKPCSILKLSKPAKKV